MNVQLHRLNVIIVILIAFDKPLVQETANLLKYYLCMGRFLDNKIISIS